LGINAHHAMARLDLGRRQKFVLQLVDGALHHLAQSIAMARTAKGGILLVQCAGSHTTKQRLARLLLQANDCFGTERSVTLTQDSLGEMLLARRERAAALFISAASISCS